jgi:hypothetical protein
VLQLEVPLAEVTRAAQLADRRGALVVLNAAPAMSLPVDLLDAVDVLVVNEHEAATVARAASLPVDPMDFCIAAADRHALAAIVTLGASGVVAANAGTAIACPPQRSTSSTRRRPATRSSARSPRRWIAATTSPTRWPTAPRQVRTPARSRARRRRSLRARGGRPSRASFARRPR